MYQLGLKYNTDKVTHHKYHEIYDTFLQNLYNKEGSILEIGIHVGNSLKMWLELFPRAFIYGIEIENGQIGNRFNIFKADQSNTDDLLRIAKTLQSNNVFFINDDGSHIPEHQLLSFNILFPTLCEGGVYIIEDIETSYWVRGGPTEPSAYYSYNTHYGYKHPDSLIEIFKDVADSVNYEFAGKKSNRVHHHDMIGSVTFSRNCIIITKKKPDDRVYRFPNFLMKSDIPSRKIIDCFIFYNELDLLRYRLNILNNVVDCFVIVESTHTFTGKEKPLIFRENIHLFKEFLHKIIHIVIDDFPFKYPNINFKLNQQWENEYFQRNGISRALNSIILDDNDLIIISDVDEIPDPNTLQKCKVGEIKVEFNSLEMVLYYYNLETILYNIKWKHPKILTYMTFKNLKLSCNSIREMTVPSIQNGGWHLSYFGDSKFIKNKLNTFAHQELNSDLITEKFIEDKIKSNKDLFGRDELHITNTPIKSNPYPPLQYNIYLTSFLPKTNLNIAFFVRHFSERGTEVAIFDYAHYNETLLHNQSFIICFSEEGQRNVGFPSMRFSYDKFKKRFPIIEINSISDMKDMIVKYKLDFFHTLTHGGLQDIYNFEDKNIWGSCKTIKHCVFETVCKGGDFYLSISDWLNTRYKTNYTVIPHIVSLPDVKENLRHTLNIPNDAIVYGRYGAFDEFSLSFAKDAIIEHINSNDNTYFVFMNTKEFYTHSRIIHLEMQIDLDYKVKFINTCDAMIHAREMGETFALSIGEFSIKNKPIITCPSGDLGHINILQDKAIIYTSKLELIHIFNTIQSIIHSKDDWRAYTLYSPEYVMSIFNTIFTSSTDTLPKPAAGFSYICDYLN
jgi:beta-1,4-mannosyl-glycoprotein beta-1,4-N-acetylglucosaminyltransferase